MKMLMKRPNPKKGEVEFYYLTSNDGLAVYNIERINGKVLANGEDIRNLNEEWAKIPTLLECLSIDSDVKR